VLLRNPACVGARWARLGLSEVTDGGVVGRGRMSGTRSGLTFGVIACALLITTTACSSSGQDTRDSTSPSSEPPSSSVSSTSSSPSPSWTAPDYGTAKPAVDAYIAFSALVD
jgi:hypothetical protein